MPGRIVPNGALRTALGAGTNEDEALLLVASELPVYTAPPVFVVDTETLSGTLTIRYVGRM